MSANSDSVSERLRRWTRNPLGSARRGSNPLAVVSRPFRAWLGFPHVPHAQTCCRWLAKKRGGEGVGSTMCPVLFKVSSQTKMPPRPAHGDAILFGDEGGGGRYSAQGGDRHMGQTQFCSTAQGVPELSTRLEHIQKMGGRSIGRSALWAPCSAHVYARWVLGVPQFLPPALLVLLSFLVWIEASNNASLAQLAEHALRKRMVVGSIPTGGSFAKPPIADNAWELCGRTTDPLQFSLRFFSLPRNPSSPASSRAEDRFSKHIGQVSLKLRF